VLNVYLFLAYSLVWLIFILYAWNLSRRQERLKKELDDVKAKIQGGNQQERAGKVQTSGR